MDENTSQFASKYDLQNMVEFSEHGRYSIYPYKSIMELTIEWAGVLLYWLGALILLNIMFRRGLPKIRNEIMLFGIVGIFLYYLSILLFPLLHDYTRYIRYTIPLF